MLQILIVSFHLFSAATEKFSYLGFDPNWLQRRFAFQSSKSFSKLLLHFL